MKKSLLTALLFPLCLLGKPAIAEERQNLEPKVSVVLDYSTETQEQGAEGQNFWAFFWGDENYLYQSYNNPLELNSFERIQVEDVIKDVKYGDVDSYQELVESSKSFSENQKEVLLAALAGSLYRGSYDSKFTNEVFSQDTFFEQLQNYLATGDHSPLGVCRHISSHIEQLSNDIGLRTNAVTGRYEEFGHVYVILKRENGNGIINGPYVTFSNTKNIEKMLGIYSKDADTAQFEHLFYEDSKLKYRLVTKDGKNVLDFIGYDESLNTLKKSLTEEEAFNPRISLVLGKNDYSRSGKLNLFGFFAKLGQINGNSSSATKEINLIQAGLEGKLSFPGFIDLTPSLSVIYGNIVQQERTDKGAGGVSESFMINTHNEEGFNLSSRFAGKFFLLEEAILFADSSLELGASYKIPIGRISLTPYILSQVGLWPENLGTYYPGLKFNEVNAGTILDISFLSNSGVSVDPHYSYRNYEHEFGINAKLRTKNIQAGIGAYVTKSVYDFAPDKSGIDISLSQSFKNLGLKFSYKRESQDYDGEISNKSSLSVQGKIKF